MSSHCDISLQIVQPVGLRVRRLRTSRSNNTMSKGHILSTILFTSVLWLTLDIYLFYFADFHTNDDLGGSDKLPVEKTQVIHRRDLNQLKKEEIIKVLQELNKESLHVGKENKTNFQKPNITEEERKRKEHLMRFFLDSMVKHINLSRDNSNLYDKRKIYTHPTGNKHKQEGNGVLIEYIVKDGEVEDENIKKAKDNIMDMGKEDIVNDEEVNEPKAPDVAPREAVSHERYVKGNQDGLQMTNHIDDHNDREKVNNRKPKDVELIWEKVSMCLSLFLQ